MGNSPISWAEARKGFLTHLKGSNKADNTVRFYGTQLQGLCLWADANQVPIDKFGKRSLDQFLSDRLDQGVRRTTLHHDALAAKVFFKWCARNDILDRSPLADYTVQKAPVPDKYMPTEDDMRRLLEAIPDFWDRERNPRVAEIAPERRSFHRERSYAMFLVMLDTAARIGEILSLEVADFREGHVSIREAKGKVGRHVPVSEPTAEAVADWLKVRKRVQDRVLVADREEWLFMGETATRMIERAWNRSMSLLVAFAGLDRRITPHAVRRYSLNKLAKVNLFAAQDIAGHKDPKTTRIYTKLDPDFIRKEHDQAGVVKGLVNAKRAKRKNYMG